MHTIMTDWRSLPAGPELDRLIAERLGWTEFHHPAGAPDVWLGLPPNSGLVSATSLPPTWSTGVDVALTLIDLDWCLLQLNLTARLENPWTTSISRGNLGWESRPSPTAALTICRAWLAYMDREGKE